MEDKICELSVLCKCISPFVKSKDWEYEKEFRFVYTHDYSSDINNFLNGLQFCLKKKEYEPFYFIPIEASSLNSIIIGPKSNYDSLEHVIRNELKECHLNRVKVMPSSICIR